MRILILTQPGDVHAIAVAEALTARGAVPILWATTDFPGRADETVRFSAAGRVVTISELVDEGRPADFEVVWRRRPGLGLDEGCLHPADVEFARSECEVFRRSLIRLMAQKAFWVNPPEAAARAGSKLLQHQAALEAGFRLPDTLYGNSPQEIRSFIRQHGGRVVYKPFLPAVWRQGERFWAPSTTEVREKDLVPDAVLRSTPGIYQELVEKNFEVRVTMMGRTALAVRIDSQATAKGRLDWRKAYDELRMSPFELPVEVAAQCRDLLARLGLAFGGLDLIVTPQGETVFLEINEMGQFLFAERYCRVPLLDTFCDFLLHATADYSQVGDSERLSYSDEAFQRKVSARAEAFDKSHIKAPDRSFPDDSA